MKNHFIVTLLVLLTFNVDAQTIDEANAVFLDGNGHLFGLIGFVAQRDGEMDFVEVDYEFHFENMPNLNESASDLRMVLHDSRVTDDCRGDVSDLELFDCTNNDFSCLDDSMFTERRGEALRLDGATVGDLVGLSVAIYLDDSAVACADINNLVYAEIFSHKDYEIDTLNLVVIMQDDFLGYPFTFARWNGNVKVSRIEFRENVPIDCSTIGDYVNPPAGYNGTCAYGDLICMADLPENRNVQSTSNSVQGYFRHITAEALFCGGDISVVVFLENEIEPHFCGAFNFTNGPVYCPPSLSDVDESSAVARGPYQGHFLAVVFCVFAFYVQ